MNDTEDDDDDRIVFGQDLKWGEMSYWDKWWRIIATLACIVIAVAIIALTALGGTALYQGFQRGEDRREAENDANIQRERVMEDALRQYREGR